MAFDGIVTKQIIYELNSCLINGKINKVYEPNKNEILLGIYSNGKNYSLLINIDSSNYRMHLTTTSKPNPLSAPNFCMLLRKHLIGMKIKSISNYDLERVITIELDGFDELNDHITKKLIIELMGKHSNIILLNQNMKIIDSLRHTDTTSNATRDILPAHEYTYPISNKICFSKLTCFEEFYKYIENELSNPIDIVIVNKFNGISKLWIHYLISSLNITFNPNKIDLEKLYFAIKNIIDSNNLHCITYIDEDKNKDDYVICLDTSPTPLSVNFFLDDFYSIKETDENFKNYRNSILKIILGELNKYKKRLNNINQKLDECSEMDKYKLYGELITANLYRLQSHENTDKIILENYYDNNKEIDIPLDRTISPSLNAKKYFKKYSKLKNACEIVSLQKKDTKKEIDYIESIVYELEKAKTISDIDAIYEEISENILVKKIVNKKHEKNRVKKKTNDDFSPISYSLDGYTIYIGKNNKQNDYLTLKFANKNDIWFHTKDIHGSHVILKTDGNEISQELLNKCASIAAYYSKASLSSNVPVDYTFVRYVKKPSNAKPGMVIYTNYTTVNVIPNNFNL